MAGRIGSLSDWLRYLDARTEDEAAAELARRAHHLDLLYDELSSVLTRLLDSPTGEVADVLQVSRMALAEATGMLESVRSRFLSGERELA